VIDVNEGASTNIADYRQRALYLAGKYGGFADVGPDGSPSTGEGSPFKTYVGGTLTTSSKEWLAADGSTLPSGYFLASQPERLLLAIRQIFAQASKPSGNLAGGSLSASRLSRAQQTGAFYQGQLDSADWSGTVVRTEITYNTTTLSLEASPTPVWDAGKILTGVQAGTTTLSPFPLPADRKIFSYSNSSLSGITFTWASIDAAVQTSLKTDPGSSIVETDTDGETRLDYIRGVRTAESDTDLNYRARNNIMGDSINSAPILKGKPSTTILDASYQSFYSTHAARTPTVYIGSNDGMLHAFYAAESATDTGNGKEQFAYVPRAISTKLNALTNPGYVKEAYVDGSITVGEARAYKSAGSAVDWATVLVSGMGGGAKGLFALDVTTPASFGPSNVLWEFTSADDADMGHLLGEPKIVKLAMAGNSAATPDYKWFAMVTSGYNNYTTGGSSDKQALFLLSLEKAPGTAWALGTNYFKIYADNAAFATADTSAATGMGMPGTAPGIAGNTLYAYAGDLQGNLWKFDLSDASTTWTGTTKAKILFTARTPDGTATQPITVVPAVTLSVVGGYQIGFGTGKFIEPPDSLATSARQQSIYGIWDAQDDKKFERVATTSPSVNGLITRTLTVTTGTQTVSITGPEFVYGTSTTIGSGQYRGWVANLFTTMERVVVDPTVGSGLMAVNSTVPGGDPCVATGASNQYRYNPSTGITFTTTGSVNTTGSLGSASLLEVGDSAWSTRNAAGRYLVTRKINSISPGVGGGLNTQESTVTTIAGRISWREITNFQ
jgi:type IV pilus assembly protein PilY1